MCAEEFFQCTGSPYKMCKVKENRWVGNIAKYGDDYPVHLLY